MLVEQAVVHRPGVDGDRVDEAVRRGRGRRESLADLGHDARPRPFEAGSVLADALDRTIGEAMPFDRDDRIGRGGIDANLDHPPARRAEIDGQMPPGGHA